jgi:hypothetical protein
VLGRFRARLAVGRPFEECPKCRTLVGRPSSKEWDLLGPGEKLYWLVDRSMPFLVFGLVPGLVYWALAFREGQGDLRVLVALLSAGPLLVALFPLPAPRARSAARAGAWPTPCIAHASSSSSGARGSGQPGCARASRARRTSSQYGGR